MARIYCYKTKNGKSTWFLDYSFKGKRYRKKVGTSKKVALLELKDIEVKISKGEYKFEPNQITIIDFFEVYKKYSSVNHAQSTYNRYRAIIDNFMTFLDRKKDVVYLSDLHSELFEDFKIFRRTTPLNHREFAKTNTVNMELVSLGTIFNYAIKCNYLKENPTKGVSKLKVTDAKKPRFLTEEEVDKLLQNCGEYLYPIFFTFLNTGMRLGELLHLTWNDVNLKQKKIHIVSKKFWNPKTGERTIPMNEEMTTLLKELKSKSNGSMFVFPGKNGERLKIKLRERFMIVTKNCGFPDVTKIHSLRHTFASHLVMKGVDLPTVKNLMGHSDIQTTMIYAHLAPDHLADAVEKLEF